MFNFGRNARNLGKVQVHHGGDCTAPLLAVNKPISNSGSEIKPLSELKSGLWSEEEHGNPSLKPIFSPNSLNLTSVIHFVPPVVAVSCPSCSWCCWGWFEKPHTGVFGGFWGVWADLGSFCLDKAEVVWGLHQAQFAKVMVEIFGLEQQFWGSFAAR